ncbi:NACHT domain-containing protein [Candidatus Jidaibacter acanthamoebae]|nr:NACHT domain-containing protein [Candidatus Jidaibacter acanthamoeba]
MGNLDYLNLIITNLVDDKKQNIISGLPYDVYVKNDLVQGIACYNLIYLLQTTNAQLFVIEGIGYQELHNFLKREGEDKFALEESDIDKNTRYYLTENHDTKQKHKEKLIYIFQPEFKFDEEMEEEAKFRDKVYIHLRLINAHEFEFIVKSKADEVSLPIPSRYDFTGNMLVTHDENKLLQNEELCFSILAANAGFGKSAFCLNQRYIWQRSKELKEPFCVIRINLPQLQLPNTPLLPDAFTRSSTVEDWPEWKFKALEHDMEIQGKVLLLLDGFDEIKDVTSVQRFNDWLSKTCSKTNIIITTRPYAANKLISPAQPLGYYLTLKEYNEEQHREYIYKYLEALFKEFHKSGISKLKNLEIKELSNKVYEKLKLLIGDSVTHLLGIPLESYIFCEALKPHIRE